MLLRGLSWLVAFQLAGTVISLLVSMVLIGWLMQKLIHRQARNKGDV